LPPPHPHALRHRILWIPIWHSPPTFAVMPRHLSRLQTAHHPKLRFLT
jgi:hypothetical protein